MIHVTIDGAGGWLSVLLWLGMAVGVPAFCFYFGREIGRDQAKQPVGVAGRNQPNPKETRNG